MNVKAPFLLLFWIKKLSSYIEWCSPASSIISRSLRLSPYIGIWESHGSVHLVIKLFALQTNSFFIRQVVVGFDFNVSRMGHLFSLTQSDVLSTKQMPVHLSCSTFLIKSANRITTSCSYSTKQMYEITCGNRWRMCLQTASGQKCLKGVLNVYFDIITSKN